MVVRATTFAAVWVRKDRIKIDFRLEHDLDSPRFTRKIRMSARRFLFYMDILSPEEIDAELIAWLKEAYDLTKS